MSDLENLLNFDHQTQALNQISGRLGWDQETMMPSGSAEQRGQEMAAIEGVLHARRSNSKIGEWLSNLDISADLAVTAQVREIRRSYERALKVPADLAEAIAQKTSVAQGKWASARAADDFAAFAPVLEEVLKLKREEGLALASGADVYDAMLQDYEPGISSADLDNMFGAMRPGLIDLRAKILEKEPVNSLKGTFDDATQMR
ncbi:MAG: hypothetical protein ACKVKR_14050, partial [Pseudomonadales bacterium]